MADDGYERIPVYRVIHTYIYIHRRVNAYVNMHLHINKSDMINIITSIRIHIDACSLEQRSVMGVRLRTSSWPTFLGTR